MNINIKTNKQNCWVDILYPNDKNIIDTFKDKKVILFVDKYLLSFYHGIHNLYYFLHNYIKNNETKEIIIPKINKKHFYYQFLNIFISDEKILQIEYNKTYKFKHIKIYDNIKRAIGNKNNYLKINKNDFIHLDFVNKLLKEKIKNKSFKKYDKVFIYRSNKNTIVENNRIFHNYENIVSFIQNKYKEILIFKPEEYNLEEQIYIMMNCSLLITDWGSSLANNLWMKENSTCMCLVHPWMAYFGKNQKNSTYLYTAKYLKINFICQYCYTYYKDKLISSAFIKREDTKKSWNSKLDDKYKYIIDITQLNKNLLSIT